MDDQHFDQQIKKQLESYVGPDFDPTALSDLRCRLASVTMLPWYVRYRTELLVVAALLLFTLFNVLWQTHTDQNRDQELVRAMDSLKLSQQTITTLREQLAAQASTASESASEKAKGSAVASASFSPETDDWSVLLERASRNDPDAQAFLRQVADMLRSENTTVQPDRPTSPNLPRLSSASYHFPWAVPSDSTQTTVGSVAKESGKTDQPKKRVSAATARALKKHNQRGIGLRLGPVAGLSGVYYSSRPPSVNVVGGLLADWVLSPALSVETGAVYAPREFDQKATAALRNLPGIDESLGQLEEVDIASQVIQFPLNLKLYLPLSGRTEGVVSTGYSFLLYLHQDLEYSYTPATDSQRQGFKSVFEQSKHRFYPGTVNVTVGTSTLLENQGRLEFSLRYQYGLGLTGLEQVKASTLGLRTAYWFTVR